MRFAAPFPGWLTALLLAGAAVIAYRAYADPIVPLSGARRLLLSGLRFATLLALLVCLAQPVRPVPVPPDAVVPVLVDRSRSMALDDVDGRTRFEGALAFVREALEPALAGTVRIELLAVGDAVAPLDPADARPEAPRSDLGRAVSTVAGRYGGTAPAIVLISDGADTTPHQGAPPTSATADAIPVFTVGVGALRVSPDREVIEATAGPAVVAGSTVDLTVAAVAHGFGDAPIEVRLRQDGRIVQTRLLRPSADGAPVRTRLTVAPDPERATRYTVEIPLDPTELVPDNNTRSVLVPPATRPRRLLLVEGGPGYDHSFLKRVWRGDPGLRIDAVIQKGQNDRGERTFYIQGTPDGARALSGGFPATRDALFRYDALVLAGLDAALLRPAEAALIVAFVSERGGGLLVLGSRSFAGTGLRDLGLASLLPLGGGDGGDPGVPGLGGAAAPWPVTLTAAGAAHPVMRLGPEVSDLAAAWAAVPPLGDVVALGPPGPGASVLLHASDGGAARPVVAVRRFGPGRTMVFAGEASWRWQMLLPSTDDTYERFWGQAARWLGSEAPEAVAVEVEGGESAGEPVRIQVRVADAGFRPIGDAAVVVSVEGPDGKVVEAPARPVAGVAGRYTALVEPPGRGALRVVARVEADDVTARRVETTVLVGEQDMEMADARRQDGTLERLAERSGGRVFELDEAAELAAAIRARLAGDGAVASVDLWDSVWVFLGLVVLLSVEWGARRRWGLR